MVEIYINLQKFVIYNNHSLFPLYYLSLTILQVVW